MSTLPPWTKVAMPHDDVRDESAVKAEYAVNLGRVDRRDDKLSKHYADPKAFFAATYLTADLRRLLSDVMAALGGKKVDRVLQLRTPFGGGKTHSLVAMLHVARDRKALASLKDIKDLPDPGPTSVAALPCADLTPGKPRKVKDGPTIHTLWGELAWRLGGDDAYESVKAIDERMTAPGSEVIEDLLSASKKPTLILADEILVYVEKAMTVPAGESTLGRQTLAFLQSLTETVSGIPNAVFVYSLQASVAEAIGDEGLLQILDKLVGRVDARRVPVQDEEVKEIIRRRIFKSLGDESTRRQVATAYSEEHRRYALASAETKADRARADEDAKRLQDEIIAAYPFHPALLRLMYERWGSLPSYQRTRGALQFLGTIVHALFKRGHAGALISPGDLPLDDPDVRAEFFRQVGEREKWDSVLDADIASPHARARQVDRAIGESSPALAQARVGSTTATAITLYSFGARKDEMRGVTPGDLIATCLAPGVEPPVVQSAIGALRESLLYLHSSGGRFRMDTIPSLTKLIEESVQAVGTDEVVARIQETLSSLLKNAPTAILWPANPSRIPDGRREFLLAYLPMEWAEQGADKCATHALMMASIKSEGDRSGKRTYRNGVGFAVPQKSHTDQARALTRKALALEALRRKAKSGQVQVSAEQLDELDDKHRAAVKDLEGACRGMYGQILLPVRGKSDGPPIALRTVELGTLAATGTDLHGRVLDLLKKQVFTEITPDRFVEFLGLDTPNAPAAIPVSEALDAFFELVDRPKMRTDAPLLMALSEAVESKKVGYVPAATVDGDRVIPNEGVRVRFGTRHDPEEFAGEDGAYILSASLASSLVESIVEPTKPTNQGKTQQDETPPGGHRQTLFPDPKPVPKGSHPKRFTLRATAPDKKSYIKLAQIVNQLFGLSASMRVTMEVDAGQPEGYDPIKLRNTVQERLSEEGIDHDAKAGE